MCKYLKGEHWCISDYSLIMVLIKSKYYVKIFSEIGFEAERLKPQGSTCYKCLMADTAIKCLWHTDPYGFNGHIGRPLRIAKWELYLSALAWSVNVCLVYNALKMAIFFQIIFSHEICLKSISYLKKISIFLRIQLDNLALIQVMPW